MSGGIYNLTSTPNDRFLRNFCMADLNSFWCLIWDTNLGFTSNKTMAVAPSSIGAHDDDGLSVYLENMRGRKLLGISAICMRFIILLIFFPFLLVDFSRRREQEPSISRTFVRLNVLNYIKAGYSDQSFSCNSNSLVTCFVLTKQLRL